jgi:hypothetical protein
VNRQTRCAVLEAIVAAPDASPSDRLRALELLREFDEDGRAPFTAAVEAIADDELEREMLDLLAPCGGGGGVIAEALSGSPSSPLGEVLADVLGPGVRFPDLAAAVRAEVERRDVCRVEERVERLAERRAAELVRELREREASEAARAS